MNDRAFIDNLRSRWLQPHGPGSSGTGPGAELSARRGGGRAIARSNWKGAEYSRLYSAWVANLMSPDDEIKGDLRSLRARGRELARNNPHARAFLELVTTNVLGPHGPQLRPQVRDDAGDLDVDVNAAIQEAWLEWSRGPVTVDGMLSFAEYSELMLETAVREGETFSRAYVGDDLPHGLALQGIDPDLVDDSYTLTPGASSVPEIRMGVEVDARGRRIAYHVLDYPYVPGSRYGGRIRVAGSEVDHVYRLKRTGQTRGVTWLAAVMHVLHQLDGYHEAELVHARAGASQMGFIEWDEASLASGVRTDPLPNADDDPGGTEGAGEGGTEPRVVMDAEPLTVRELIPGQRFKEWAPQHPTTAFADFVKSNLATTATGLLVSYLSLANDPGAANYSSMRSALLLERDLWLKLQQWWIRRFCQPIFERWLQTAILTGRLQLQNPDWRAYSVALWQPRGWEWVDPLKDASAAETSLRLGLTSRTRILGEQGEDFEEVLEELAREEQLAKEKDVKISATPAAPAAAAPTDEPGADVDGAGDEPRSTNGNGATRSRVLRSRAAVLAGRAR